MQRQQYRNMDDIMTEKTWKQFQRWRTERKVRLQHKDYSFAVPHVEPDMQRLMTNRTDTTATWIGHSTFLLQMGSLNMATDPIWASTMAMQKRLTEPGIPIEQMPPIDVILISHSHYDHLHLKSLRQLANDNTLVIVPSGLRSKMKRKGFPNTIQLKWWESATIGDVRITFVPAQHWTRRTLTDTNRSHWGGYVFEHVDAKCDEVKETIYFAGDSGYFRGFSEIGERFAIDIAMLPIGAYEPEWFMGAQHVTPEEALQAFIDVKAKLMLPMHYGAFKLADDTPKEAIDRLLAERDRLGIDAEQIRLMALGETCDLKTAFCLQKGT
ncbi:MBL fold metallo-hydrolase [Paenibacillus sp. ACRRX]|uniref:MBL fold metallo-hydrolase n=1 Tax=Paenibacillus sp. ACRRX TaxID=2918206 RepID=UPI001EF6C7FB|nr:MBL fold metallo-hydrolase [Paenibacillus sp. ACRRX]MCG7409050.1 MBL fold metallo-hydrolase [Paenibacillus sp. ACRRX]